MSVGCIIGGLKRRLLALTRDEGAAVSVDFVVAIPILLAVLVFTAEYGRVLQVRSVLDNAVSDSVRYLARVPHDGNCVYDQSVIDVAEQFITSRVPVSAIAIGSPSCEDKTADSGIAGFETVSLSVSVGVETPALSVIALANYSSNESEITAEAPDGGQYTIALNELEGFVLTATDSARYFGQ